MPDAPIDQHPSIRSDWLAARTEEVIDPEQPIVDPHQHVWDRPGWRYVFDDLLADMATGHNVRASVYVQARAMLRAYGPDEYKSVGEVEFANGLAAMSASGAYGQAKIFSGIVGHVDMMLGERVRPILEAQLGVTGGSADSGGRYCGIRYVAAWDPDPWLCNALYPTSEDLLGSASFRAAFRHLQDLNLTFETWIYFPQLHRLAELARAFPQTPIVLNHCGGIVNVGAYAGRREEVYRHWSAGLRELAQHPNVMVKLGGLGMRVSGFDFHLLDRPPSSADLAEACRPWIETCIETFGPTRCMFESNFPVDKTAYSYPVYWNAMKRIVSAASKQEKDALFYRNAALFYRLAIEPPQFELSTAPKT